MLAGYFTTVGADLNCAGNDFDEVDFNVANDDEPDGVVLDAAVKSENCYQRTNNVQPQAPPDRFQRQGVGPGYTPQTPSPPPNLPGLDPGRPQASTVKNNTPNPTTIPSHDQNHSALSRPQPLATPLAPTPQANPVPAPSVSNDATLLTSSSDTLPIDAPVGFYNAKAAESVQKGAVNLREVPTFNLHGESPSIRKTAGVDHSRSKPIRSEVISGTVQGAAGSAATVKPTGSNFVNPHIDKARRVGMPSVGGSPLSNRSTYKPPQMKRPALADVTAGAANVGIEPIADGKRQKVGEVAGSHGVVS